MTENIIGKPKIIATWLFIITLLVVAQAVIGAVTRLTESGLSIVYWEPIRGALYPMTEADWIEELEHYRTSPQYQHVNKGMAMEDFKVIFFWEWFHRNWARLIGLLYAIPLVFFWLKNWIPLGYKKRLFGLLLLGGAQAFMGWYMVASGLIDNPAVSHYRLATHLTLALIIAVIAYKWSLNLRGVGYNIPRGLYKHGRASYVMLLITIIYGAFVAGLDAGLIYNEFPTMGTSLFPSEGLAMQPAWINPFENHATVQFIHRWLGILTGLMILAFGLRGWTKSDKNGVFIALSIFAVLQPSLGLLTLLSNVHIHPATLHQLGAFILALLLTRALVKTPLSDR